MILVLCICETRIVFSKSGKKITDREVTHLSVELTFDTASFMLTPESTGFQKDQQQKDSATSATAGSIVHPEFNDLLAINKGILNSVARIYFQTTPPQSMEEFKRFREYMIEMKALMTGFFFFFFLIALLTITHVTYSKLKAKKKKIKYMCKVI